MFPGDLLLTNTHKIQDQNRSRREWGGGGLTEGGGGVLTRSAEEPILL